MLHDTIGIAGLYDYGPPGAALQANIINEWRKHFIIEEMMTPSGIVNPTELLSAPTGIMNTIAYASQTTRVSQVFWQKRVNTCTESPLTGALAVQDRHLSI